MTSYNAKVEVDDQGEIYVDVPETFIADMGWEVASIPAEGHFTIYYGQDKFNSDVEQLVTQINKTEPYDYIVGIARGGLILATTLSHRLDVPMEPITWQTRDGGVKSDLTQLSKDIKEGKRVLIVDDLIDSGLALQTLIEALDVERSDIDIAVLYYNTSQSINPDFFTRLIDRRMDERWIVFWWEAQI